MVRALLGLDFMYAPSALHPSLPAAVASNVPKLHPPGPLYTLPGLAAKKGLMSEYRLHGARNGAVLPDVALHLHNAAQWLDSVHPLQQLRQCGGAGTAAG
jgi:hypothetical protein